MKRILTALILIATTTGYLNAADSLVWYDADTGQMSSYTNGNANTNLSMNGSTFTNINASTLSTPYCKFHNTNDVTFTAANTWTNMIFIFTPTNENSYGFDLGGTLTNTITMTVDGLAEINGCVRSYWTGGNNTAASVASRIVYSGDNWVTTNEARCLQAYWSRERKANDYQTIPFAGSLYVTNGLEIRLQVQVSSTDMQLEQAILFDQPLSVTFNAWIIGK